MTDPVLSVSGLSKSFGALKACDDVDLDLRVGEIHALIGPNGAGKSTLIEQIAGGLRPDTGTITFTGRDITRESIPERARMGLARSFQISAVIPDYSVSRNIALAVLGKAGRQFRMFGSAAKDRDAMDRAAEFAARVGLSHRLEVRAADLAHGERRKLEIAMALALEPKAFLLDEPMAGIGAEGTVEMTRLLDGLRREAPILLVEHDMNTVFALADRITVLVYGRVIATGGVDEIRAHPEVRQAYLGDEVPA